MPTNAAGGGAIAGMGVNGPDDVKVKKKKKKLMMKEKYTGKDSNVKFNSRGGMLKKGKK